jgi:hypothetical protein
MRYPSGFAACLAGDHATLAPAWLKAAARMVPLPEDIAGRSS